MKSIALLFVSLLLFSCTSKTKTEVDTLVTNATIYTVNTAFEKATAMAIKDGKILAIGNTDSLLKKYTPKTLLDYKGKFIYPGLIDAHCHFYSYGLTLQEVDLRGTNSFEEILMRLKAFQKAKKPAFIVGNGWDQNDWTLKSMFWNHCYPKVQNKKYLRIPYF